MKRLILIALPLLATAPALAQEQECMPGVSCHQMAAASVSFGIARDCPQNFVIKPDLKPRYNDIIRALKSAQGKQGVPPLASKRQKVAAGLCDNVARKVLSGQSKIEFLAVKPNAASRLMSTVK
jgi:hypothetical protein